MVTWCWFYVLFLAIPGGAAKCVHFSFGMSAPQALVARVTAIARAINELWGSSEDSAYFAANAHEVLDVPRTATETVS